MANFKHSYTRRCHNHDYRAPFIYHVILKKAEGCVPYGTPRGDARIRPGEKGSAFIERNFVGNSIAKAIFQLGTAFQILQIYQYSVMPDHVHILLRIKEWSEMPLGYYISKFKRLVVDDLNDRTGEEFEPEMIFEENYCDKPLTQTRSLDRLYRYIRENPHRLLIRMQFPHFFQRTRSVVISSRSIEAYGNLFLLRNPDKEAVKVSRSQSKEELEEMQSHWLEQAWKGTVIVSPFISPKEKELRRKFEETGAKIILVIHEALSERYKPAAHDFDLCTDGKLLIVSLGYPIKTPLSREICIEMNEWAKKIADIT